jgi:hypothetical protein
LAERFIGGEQARGHLGRLVDMTAGGAEPVSLTKPPHAGLPQLRVVSGEAAELIELLAPIAIVVAARGAADTGSSGSSATSGIAAVM